jgi:hypothetical protein
MTLSNLSGASVLFGVPCLAERDNGDGTTTVYFAADVEQLSSNMVAAGLEPFDTSEAMIRRCAGTAGGGCSGNDECPGHCKRFFSGHFSYCSCDTGAH